MREREPARASESKIARVESEGECNRTIKRDEAARVRESESEIERERRREGFTNG